MNALTVEKIGGTSMSRFSEVLTNIILNPKAPLFGRIYVVSAYAGVTNALLENKKTGLPGIYGLFARADERYRSLLAEVLTQLKRENRKLESLGLDVAKADAFVEERMASAGAFLENLEELFATGYVAKRELLLSAREYLASIGESHAAFNSAQILQRHGHPSRCLDLSGGHDVRELTIDERIADALREAQPEREICVATGYTKGVEGIMRVFDRGYSEVTFSKIAVQVRAHEAVIHKEYHLSSADPLIVGTDRVRTVGDTNFDVADQLADVGMEAIHPRAAKPLEMAGIPIRVKNAFEPDHAGTRITRAYVAASERVDVIAGTESVVTVEVCDTLMVGEAGFDRRIMEAISPLSVSYISKSTNANTISFVVLEADATDELLSRIKAVQADARFIPCSIVCVIGTNLGGGRILGRAAMALTEAAVPVLAVSQATRPVNIQFVIGRDHYATAVRAIHRAVIEQ